MRLIIHLLDERINRFCDVDLVSTGFVLIPEHSRENRDEGINDFGKDIES